MDSRLNEADISLPGGAIQRVRYFTDAAIQNTIDETLDGIEPGRRGVILRGRVDSEGVAAVLAARLNNHWSIGLIADYSKVTKDWGVGFESVFEW